MLLAAEFTDQVADFADLAGVEADRQLASDDDIAMHNRLRDADALLITFDSAVSLPPTSASRSA